MASGQRAIPKDQLVKEALGLLAFLRASQALRLPGVGLLAAKLVDPPADPAERFVELRLVDGLEQVIHHAE